MASDFASSVPPPDVLRELEKIEQFRGEEIWEIAWRFRIHRRRSDDELQTVEVEMMRHRDLGWHIDATDADRNISALGNPDPDLNVAIHIVHWNKLDGPAMPPDPRR
jgi:hypothetical protein